nr:reverse transcriptase domain-containing protein [Tanacetum cinerariifolium]
MEIPLPGWERYKDLLRACPHHGFTELHQLDTFYNALNPADQDSLNATAGGNLLEKSPQDALRIIKNKSKVRNSRSKPIASPVNACDINSSAHHYYQCLAVGGNTFPEFRDNIQGYVSAAASNYNQGNPGYHPQGVANQMRPPGVDIDKDANDIYSLIDSNKTAKDLWDALARHMLGSEYGKQDRKAAVLYEFKTFKATEGELLLDTYIRYLQVINDLK